MLLFADQNLLAPNLTAVVNEFGFGPNERDAKLGGHIALAFFVLGAPASFVVGCLADTWPRSPLFAAIVLMGEGSCMLTYWSQTYRQLVVLRALTGISVGGALPLIASVLGDLYAPEQRSAVMAAVGVGIGIGIALGQGVTGFLGPTYGWRYFLVVSVPAMVCGVLVLLLVRDPERGAMDIAPEDGLRVTEEDAGAFSRTGGASSLSASPGASSHSVIEMSPVVTKVSSPQQDGSFDQHGQMPSPISDMIGNERHYSSEDVDAFRDDECDNQISRPNMVQKIRSRLLDWRSWSSHLRTLKSLLSCRTVLLALLQGAPGCLPWGIINTFLNDYLSEDCGMTVEGATLTITAFGFGNFLGMVVGGAGGNYLYRLDPRFPSLLSGFAAVLGCVPTWILLNSVNASRPALYAMSVSILAGLGSGVTGPIVKSTLQNVTLPESRGQGFAFLNFFDDFGRGLGPVFVAVMIASMGGRRKAFNVGVLGWVLCGVLNASMFFTVKGDEERMRSSLAFGLRRREGEGRGEVAAVGSTVEVTRDPKADAVPLLT